MAWRAYLIPMDFAEAGHCPYGKQNIKRMIHPFELFYHVLWEWRTQPLLFVW